MKKKELKKRIENGFSQLSPDIFQAVLEESSRQETVWAKAETEESSADGKVYTRRLPRYALSLCASLAVLCLCILGVLGQREDSVYMVIDINPSIQVEMNEEHQVKRLKGLNQDGKDVVKELKWKKEESVQELLDVLIQDVVEKSYLRENEGILVTLAAPDKYVCENLERTLGEGIDRKLTELKVSGVTTAFREINSRSERGGRKLLEAELTKSCGLDKEQVQQMSVMELIQYCQDYTSVELKLSEASEKEREVRQKGPDKQKTQGNSSSGESSEKKPGDNTSEKTKNKPDKNGANIKGTEKESCKEKSGNGKPDSPKDNQEEEGNTNDQESADQSESMNLGNSAQMEESAPSDAGAPIQPGDGKPLDPGDALGQQENENQSESGGTLEQPVTPGQSGAEDMPEQPETTNQPDVGDVSERPEEPKQPDAGDMTELPETSEQPETGDIPEQLVTPEQPEPAGAAVHQERYKTIED